jgi:hypothetical protein
VKKIITIFSFLIIIITLLIGINVLRQGPNANQAKTKMNSIDLESWIGNYSFSECAPPNQNMFYSISVYKENSNYYAKIEIDGFQTLQRLQAIVEGDKNRIKLLFYKYLPDNTFEPYSKGDVLLSFKKNNSKLYTAWRKIEPLLLKNKTENVYFEKDK